MSVVGSGAGAGASMGFKKAWVFVALKTGWRIRVGEGAWQSKWSLGFGGFPKDKRCKANRSCCRTHRHFAVEESPGDCALCIFW